MTASRNLGTPGLIKIKAGEISGSPGLKEAPVFKKINSPEDLSSSEPVFIMPKGIRKRHEFYKVPVL